MVEPVTTTKGAKKGPRVQTLLREVEATGVASIRTTYRRARVQLPAMSSVAEDLNAFASVATIFSGQRFEAQQRPVFTREWIHGRRPFLLII